MQVNPVRYDYLVRTIMDEIKKNPEKEVNNVFRQICHKHCRIKKLPSDTFNNYTVSNYPAIPETREEIKELRNKLKQYQTDFDYIQCYISHVALYHPSQLEKIIPQELFSKYDLPEIFNETNEEIDTVKWKKEHELLVKYLMIRNILEGVI